MPWRSQAEACGIATVNAFVSMAGAMAIDPLQIGVYLGALCDRHRDYAMRGLAWMAQANGLTTNELLTKLTAAIGLKAAPFHVPPH
jgi:hypothetical protein